VEAVQAGTKNATHDIEEVTRIIGQINQISNAIASAVENQTVNTKEIGRNVQEAANRTHEMAGNTGAVAQLAQDTARAVSDVQNAAQSLTELAAGMRGMVSEFRF
jgi:methyl-accepting chemotaxis protein